MFCAELMHSFSQPSTCCSLWSLGWVTTLSLDSLKIISVFEIIKTALRRNKFSSFASHRLHKLYIWVLNRCFRLNLFTLFIVWSMERKKKMFIFTCCRSLSLSLIHPSTLSLTLSFIQKNTTKISISRFFLLKLRRLRRRSSVRVCLWFGEDHISSTVGI